MSHRRRAVGLLAGGAMSVALLAPSATVVAQDASTVPASAAPAVTVSEACQAAALDGVLKNPGRLTLSTDNPAFPPWWTGDPREQYPLEPEGGDGWEYSDDYPTGDPFSQQGYESAVAWATAAALGFAPEQVDWIPNAVFEVAFQPGPKPFDWHMAQVAINPERAESVDFSDSYFDANQSLIALADNDIASATSIADLKDHALGAAVATTSFQFIEDIDPAERRAAGLQRQRGRPPGPPERAGRRCRGRPAVGVLHGRGAADGRHHRGPVQELRGRGGEDGHGPREGQPADGLRERGDRGPAGVAASSRPSTTRPSARTRTSRSSSDTPGDRPGDERLEAAGPLVAAPGGGRPQVSTARRHRRHHRDGQHGPRAGRRGFRRSSTRPAGRRCRRPSSTGRSSSNGSRRSCWAFRKNVELFVVGPGPHPDRRAVPRDHAWPAGARVLPHPRGGDHLHRRHAWHPERARHLPAGVRHPGAPDSRAPRPTPSSGALIALTLLWSAYVAEVYRAGIESVHPSQNAAARSLGLSHDQAMRYVVLPQAVRRVIPPLLNDFIGLHEGHRAGLVHRSRRGLPASADHPVGRVQLHAVPGDRGDLPGPHDPDGAVRRLARRARPASTGGGRPMTTAELGSAGRGAPHRGAAQVLRRARGPQGHRPRRRRARGRLPHRRLGLGQVDAAALREPARADRRRAGSSSRARRSRPAA